MDAERDDNEFTEYPPEHETEASAQNSGEHTPPARSGNRDDQPRNRAGHNETVANPVDRPNDNRGNQPVKVQQIRRPQSSHNAPSMGLFQIGQECLR